MKESFEHIWKEGFLADDALVVPKVNQLYDRKSEHIIDKYKYMFNTNIYAILIGACVLLAVTLFFKIPYLGVTMFLMLVSMALVDRSLLVELEKIDKNVSSYEYLISIEAWMKHKTDVNIIMARIFYPVTFLSILLGFWFLEIKGRAIGLRITEEIINHFPNTSLFLGVPLWGLLAVLGAMLSLAYLGETIYKWDVNLVYGGVVEKLQDLIADMEELRD